MKNWKIIAILVIVIIFISQWTFKNFNFNNDYKVGDKIDSLNGVVVYYNGGVDNVTERHTTVDNYNLGLKYQCVEFVKRYYYEYYNHKMPDAMGNAKDFFNESLGDSTFNSKRNLTQFSNPSISKPKVNDLLIFGGSVWNRYGHVAIISNGYDNEIEIIQQNPGPFSPSREKFQLNFHNNRWKIEDDRILGWLRKEEVSL